VPKIEEGALVLVVVPMMLFIEPVFNAEGGDVFSFVVDEDPKTVVEEFPNIIELLGATVVVPVVVVVVVVVVGALGRTWGDLD